MRPRSFSLALAVACLAAGCAGAEALAASLPPDSPVPAEEPRETFRLKVDLKRAANCDEAFDLGLYQNRGVELIEWEASTSRCAGRVASVRYLSRRTKREDVVRAATALALKVEVVGP
jgi:hypothetical protein